MKNQLFLLISLTAILHAADPVVPTGSLSSTNATYNGNTLVLTGQVLLDHGLGKLHAEEAELERQEGGKEFPFSLIHLKKEVLLSLKNRGELRCASADLDFAELKGELFSEEKEKVTFTKDLFRLLSQSVAFKMIKSGEKPEYEIDSLLAKDDVIIDYANAFTLRCDRAKYSAAGLVTAFPKDEDGTCVITHEGDRIEGSNVDVDLERSLIHIHHPKGSLATTLVPRIQKGELQFTSDDLSWDHPKNTLTLKGQVHVDESHLGNLTCDEELKIVQNKEKHILSSFLAKGNSMLQYQDEGSMRTFVSHGLFFLDGNKLQATIESPITNGVTTEDKQIHYEEDRVAIHADQASLEYALNENALKPISMVLKGNVRLASTDPSMPHRLALADRISYAPTTRTLILSANPGGKVLFWDEEQNMRISGQEIHVTQDPTTKKESIKGVGNIKFTFSSDEETLLKKIFPHYKGSK